MISISGQLHTIARRCNGTERAMDAVARAAMAARDNSPSATAAKGSHSVAAARERWKKIDEQAHSRRHSIARSVEDNQHERSEQSQAKIRALQSKFLKYDLKRQVARVIASDRWAFTTAQRTSPKETARPQPTPITKTAHAMRVGCETRASWGHWEASLRLWLSDIY
eukprot:6214363-Pleurochrysis_carterae.AAC.1